MKAPSLVRVVRRLGRTLTTMVWFRTVPLSHSVKFVGVSRVFFNPDDGRARWLRRSAGVTQPVVTWLWHRLVRQAAPVVAIDVGANYGEVSLSTRYPPGTRVLLVEANPSLVPYLRKSCATHSERSALVLEPCFASDSPGDITLVVDEKWSGTSSSVVPVTDAFFKGPGKLSQREVRVPAVTVDELMERVGADPGGALIAKIDVEGAEARVLAGMRKALRTRADWAIILEYNSEYVGQGELSPTDYFAMLQSLGAVHLMDGRRWLSPVRSLAELDGGGTDLLVTSGSPRMEEIVGSLSLPMLLRLAFLRAGR